MINSKIASLALAFVILNTPSLISQTETKTETKKESVILYNNKPVKVELTENGQIQTFISEVPDYMKGFNTASGKGVAIQTQKVLGPQQAVVETSGYHVVSSDQIILKYRPGFATLERNTINALNEIAARLKSDPEAKVLLIAQYTSSEPSRLISNRFASASTYLNIKGIALDRIRTEIQVSDAATDIVLVNYLN